MKLLVVDDEKMTREGIARSIGGGLGIRQIELADCGMSAICKLDAFQPDIVLTDVRMPLMDGIELASKVRSRLPECKIIFMSGYTDKEYLKSAIQLKAINYIEKPIDFDELKEALQTAVSLGLEEQQSRRRITELNRTLLESIPLMKAEIASQLTSAGAEVGYLLDRARTAGLALPEFGVFQTVIVKFEPRHAGGNEAEWMPVRTAVHHEAETFLIRRGMGCLSVLKDGSTLVCHLLNPRAPISALALEELAGRLSASYADRIHVSVASGQPVGEIKRVFRSYEQAEALLPAAFYHASGTVLSKAGNPEPFVFDPGLPERFMDCVTSESQEEAQRLLDDLAAALERRDRTPVESTKRYYCRLLAPLADPAGKDGDGPEPSPLWETINRFVSLRDIADFADAALCRSFEERRKEKGTRRIVREAIRYIHRSYADEELSIQKICEFTFLTPAYLCSLFKAHTNQTINGYITEYRMHKAKSLLSDPKLTIQQIAVLVGYSNSNYFAKVFRKQAGMTPSEYRERLS
ncbi:response regulator [Paenibacillus humicola]|uniref:response regulator n=1 Tax=Paenibacillus humicola TaxID=3110540 RepID=UPI00237C1C21|nr:response regulator [Paenibacillus humicola]